MKSLHGDREWKEWLELDPWFVRPQTGMIRPWIQFAFPG